MRPFIVMRYLFTELYLQIVRTLKSPRRVLYVMDKNRLRRYIKSVSLKIKNIRLAARLEAPVWQNNATKKFKHRLYSSYEEYLEQQKQKLDYVDLEEYDIKYRDVLLQRLKKLYFLKPGTTVLCLGARLGTEVKAFLDIGCFAIGIDLNPGRNNRYVVYGDFHNLQFASSSVDVIFTNALDHVFDVRQLIDEVKRVTKPACWVIIEAVRGLDEGKLAGYCESFYWSKIDDVVNLFENYQLKLVYRDSFSYPWPGEQLVFVKRNRQGG